MPNFFKHSGILGINARNLLYIRPYNKKKAVRLADDKLKTKQFLAAREVPVPRLYAAIRNQEELERFDFSSLPSAFVLKPNLGFGGEGIIPIVGRKDGMYEKSSGGLMSQGELTEHIGDILEGRFSLSGVMDTAFFEQLIVCHEALAKFAYKGLPDIRIVVHNLIPVMAMLRLPTKISDGKANLHQGALGVGIDIAKGTATHIVQGGKIIDEVPEAGAIRGLKIPHWDEMLLAASKVQLVTNLGYLAVDMALDKNVGPVLLEINARAGLGLQVANLAPLRRRLERIQGVKVPTPEKGVRIAQDMFGHKIEKEVKKVSGKEVIGSQEKVKLLGGEEVRYVMASINPLLEGTLIDAELARDLGFEENEEGTAVKLKFSLAETRIQTLARLEDLSGKSFNMVIGRRDLKDFLIDPSKGKHSYVKLPHFEQVEGLSAQTGPNFKELDRKLIAIDRQIKLLYHLKPLNLEEEKKSFFESPDCNPQFVYPELEFDPFHLREKLDDLARDMDDSILGQLFSRKVEEVQKKVDLLEGVGGERFSENSQNLYPAPTKDLLDASRERLDQMPKSFPSDDDVVPFEQAILKFEEVLKAYGLDKWRVKIKKSMVADCLAGKQNTLFVREGVDFTSGRLRMLIAHEIETHILTAENGKHQPYGLFNRGWADYLETQEGLAIWNQSQVLTHDVEKNYWGALRVFVIDFALKHSFAETYDYCLKLGMDKERAFLVTAKMKRGFEDTSKAGSFTKDQVYMSGYLQVKNFISSGGDLRELYFGKYNLRDLPLIKQVPHLRDPLVLPNFLS